MEEDGDTSAFITLLDNPDVFPDIHLVSVSARFTNE